MSTIKQIVASIITPRYSTKSGIQCAYCPLHIFKEHEAGGVIHYSEENKPICARDRILRGRMGAIIKNDKSKRDAQLEGIEQRMQKEANQTAIRVADVSQTKTGTKRK